MLLKLYLIKENMNTLKNTREAQSDAGNKGSKGRK